MKKQKIHIQDQCSGSISSIKMKEAKGKQAFTLKNGTGFYEVGKKRMTLTKHCALGDEQAIVIENDQYIIEMDFMTLCDLKEILDHMDDFKGCNFFGKTRKL